MVNYMNHFRTQNFVDLSISQLNVIYLSCLALTWITVVNQEPSSKDYKQFFKA